jgi:hypothetical protein
VYADPDEVDFSIAVEGGDCSTATADTKCNVSTSAPFTVQASIDTFDTQKLGYQTFRVMLSFSPGLTLKQREGAGESVLHTCSDSTEVKPTGSFAFTCFDIGNSTATGVVFEADFNCTAPGQQTVTLEQASDGTQTNIVSNKATTAVDPDGDETLTVNCASLVGGAQADLSGFGTSSNAAGAIAGANAAAVVVLGLALWAKRRTVL